MATYVMTFYRVEIEDKRRKKKNVCGTASVLTDLNVGK